MRTAMGRRSIFASLLAAAWAAGLACSSFDSSDSPTDVPEAGSDGPTAGDTSTIEATAPPDAGRFCAQKDASFCQDFDLEAYPFGMTPFISGSNQVLLTDASLSPPNALLTIAEPTGAQPLDAAADDGGGSAAALLANIVRPFGSNGSALDFDIRLDEIPAVDAGYATVFALGTDSTTQVVTLVMGGGGMLLFVADPKLDGGAQKGAPLPMGNGWFHMRIEVAFDGTAVRLLVNNVDTISTPQGLTLDGQGYAVTIGTFTRANTRTKVTYDNVLVTPL